MTKDEKINTVKEDLIKYGAKKISLFGSYAQNKETPASDMDIIVEFSSVKTLLELAAIESSISEKTGTKIDLLTPKSISPYIMKKIKSDIKVIM
ncbi:MAG: nucleotidyltransferase family protein [Candidatus Goldiibacteriota bacterium]